MPSAAIITLGCRLNQADSSLLTSRLISAGYSAGEYEPGKTDLIILNSCAVTASAARKSRQTLRALRKESPNSFIVMTGCAATVKNTSFPEADIVLNNEAKKNLARLLSLKQSDIETQASCKEFKENAMSVFPLKTRANLKIQEGCNNFCSYCIVPFLRGPERSRNFSETIEDFKNLIDKGFKEILLTGINTCAYSSEGKRLPELLDALASADGDFRIRIGSTEPGKILRETVEVMAGHGEKICQFMHPSLQHGSDEVLKLMNRHCFTDEYAEIAEYARKLMPNIHIGTDIIVGFPGENDKNFEESYNFLKRMAFANMHVFPFSPREGTAAWKIKKGIVSGTDVAEREKRLLALKTEMAENFRKKLAGTHEKILPETFCKGKISGYTGNYIRMEISGDKVPDGFADVIL